MFIQEVINDYYERNDFDVSAFNYLVTAAEDYKNQAELEKLGDELSDVFNSDDKVESEINDLPF